MDVTLFMNYNHGWVSNLNDSVGKEMHADVTLVCEGGRIFAHKSVLSSTSAFFKKILSSHDCLEPVVLLENFRLPIVKLLITFIYGGYVQGTYDELGTLIDYAERLHVEGLTNCGEKLVNVELMEVESILKNQLDSLNGVSWSEDSDSDEDVKIVHEEPYKSSAPCSQKQPQKARKSFTRQPVKRPASPASSSSENKKACINSEHPEAGPTTNSVTPSAPSSKTHRHMCTVCKQRFTQKHEYYEHLEQHRDVLECGACKKLLTSRKTLKQHVLNHFKSIPDQNARKQPDKPE